MSDVHSPSIAVIRQGFVEEIRTEPPPLLVSSVVGEYGCIEQMCQREHLHIRTPSGVLVHLGIPNVLFNGVVAVGNVSTEQYVSNVRHVADNALSYSEVLVL